MEQMRIMPGVRWAAPARRRLDEQLEIETAYFKRAFVLPDGPIERAYIKISANNRYCLYVNGTLVQSGPCKGDEWHQYCDVIDIASYLAPGENIVAAKVVAFHGMGNRNNAGTNAGPMSIIAGSLGPMLIVDGGIDVRDGGQINLSTGLSDWYCMVDEAIAWKPELGAWWAGNSEVVDGSKLPHGWTTQFAADVRFEQAALKWDNGTPFGEINSLFLYERPIPMLMMEVVAPLTTMERASTLSFDCGTAQCPPNQHHTIVLEAEQLTTSFVSLRCEGGAGSKITIGYTEGFVSRDAGGNVVKGDRRDTTGEFIGTSDIYYPSGLDETYSPFLFRTFLFMQLEIETGAEPLTLHLPELCETRYPLDNRTVAQSASDAWIAPIWDISLRTLQLCMHDTYEDCPFYEQLQYTMDTRLQILYTYAISNDTRMARRTIHDFHTSMLPEGIAQSRFPTNFRQVIPAFSLHFVLMLSDYYEETGDMDVVKQYRFTMERILYWFHQKLGALGLVEQLGYWDFADWTDEWEHGVPTAVKHGPSTVHNLAYAYALKRSAPLFYAMNMPDLGAMYEREASEITNAVQRHCWDNTRQMYREGPIVQEFSQHAQVWSVLCGLSCDIEARRLMRETVADASLVQCSFVMQFYLFRALEAAGIYELTEDLWPLWKALPSMNLSTVPEIPGEKTRSDCHAWGALILYEFPRKVLGVTPFLPGYAQIEIKPLAHYIADASGIVPTPQGPVQVSRTFEAGQFRIDIDTPVPARVVLPNGAVHVVNKGKYQFRCTIPSAPLG